MIKFNLLAQQTGLGAYQKVREVRQKRGHSEQCETAIAHDTNGTCVMNPEPSASIAAKPANPLLTSHSCLSLCLYPSFVPSRTYPLSRSLTRSFFLSYPLSQLSLSLSLTHPHQASLTLARPFSFSFRLPLTRTFSPFYPISLSVYFA